MSDHISEKTASLSASVPEEPEICLLPYSMVVGQEQIKRALEIAFIAPRVGGVLLAGQRGTAKSTVVRAFCQMMYGALPITLPINATEDRVVGGWEMGDLLQGRKTPQPGLLELASRLGTAKAQHNGPGVLYIDEVNLLDDHIVNLLLDAASTGVLAIQREGRAEERGVSFLLLGTMNPSEGGLRPQLLDRFGLMVRVSAESDPEQRARVIEAALTFDAAQAEARAKKPGWATDVVQKARKQDEARRTALLQARTRFNDMPVTPLLARKCAFVGALYEAEGFRGDLVLALATRAHAAIAGRDEVEDEDLVVCTPLAFLHRAGSASGREAAALIGDLQSWSEMEAQKVRDAIHRATASAAAPTN